jgi:hypothetical protein
MQTRFDQRFFVTFFAVAVLVAAFFAVVADFLARSSRAFSTVCEGSTRLPEWGLLVGERSLRPLALVLFVRCPPLLPIDAIVETPGACR